MWNEERGGNKQTEETEEGDSLGDWGQRPACAPARGAWKLESSDSRQPD